MQGMKRYSGRDSLCGWLSARRNNRGITPGGVIKLGALLAVLGVSIAAYCQRFFA